MCTILHLFQTIRLASNTRAHPTWHIPPKRLTDKSANELFHKISATTPSPYACILSGHHAGGSTFSSFGAISQYACMDACKNNGQCNSFDFADNYCNLKSDPFSAQPNSRWDYYAGPKNC